MTLLWCKYEHLDRSLSETIKQLIASTNNKGT